MIPFPAKALKILLHDVQNSGEDATFSKEGGNDAESDDGVSLLACAPFVSCL